MEEDVVFEVCARGDTLQFQRLVQDDESVLTQTIGRDRYTPLHLACKFKHKELASFILAQDPALAKALAKANNEKEETPLHEASRVGELDIVKQLLDACPFVVYMLNRDRKSSLFIACFSGHSSAGRSEVAWELCRRMDFLVWDEIGASCLQIAASKGYTEIVRKILGENPNLASRKDEDGFSALHLASKEGNLGVIQELLGKDPNLSFLGDKDGRTPLHLAMIHNQVHIVKEFLLERSTPTSFNSILVAELINKAEKINGDTVLHLAAKINCLEIIKLLLSKPGIKVHALNNDGDSALDICPQIQARMTIIQQLKARKRANRPAPSLTDMQMKLITVAVLIMTVTFQAILSPPGGLWQDSGRPGKAIQRDTNPGLYKFFMGFNALGFSVSSTLILITMILRIEKKLYVNSLVVLELVSITVAFILSLIMIS